MRSLQEPPTFHPARKEPFADEEAQELLWKTSEALACGSFWLLGCYMLWCVCVFFCPWVLAGFEDIGPYESIGCRGFGNRAFSVFGGVSARA